MLHRKPEIQFEHKDISSLQSKEIAGNFRNGIVEALPVRFVMGPDQIERRPKLILPAKYQVGPEFHETEIRICETP